MFYVICAVDVNATPLHLSDSNYVAEYISEDDQMNNWKSKALHRTYPNYLSNYLSSPEIDKTNSTIWLKKENVYSETTEFIMATQDRCIPTKNYRKYILKEDITDDGCGKCHYSSETIEDITGSCPVLDENEYLRRHDNVAKNYIPTFCKLT